MPARSRATRRRCATCATRRARGQLRVPPVRTPGFRRAVRRLRAPVSRALSRRSVLARVRAPHPRLVCAEASRRGFRGDLRGVAHAGARLADGVRGMGRAAKARVGRRVMHEIAQLTPGAGASRTDDLPVEAMHWTVAEHYADDEALPIEDARQFDGDLRGSSRTMPTRRRARTAANFLRAPRRRARGAHRYWTGEGPTAVRSLIARARRAGRRRSICAWPDWRQRR